MSFFETWVRLSDLDKECPLCLHKDACCISRDGSKILCTRVESSLKIGEPFIGGYIHAANKEYRNLKMPKKKRIKAPINWDILCKFYQSKAKYDIVEKLAIKFNVSQKTLINLNIGWDSEAYTFPMYNAKKEIIGIQRRFPSGKKCSVKGTSLGLFIPTIKITPPLFILEGVSDLAALLDLGFYGVAKPSAQAGNDLVEKFILFHNCNKVVIVCDNDKVGVKGATKLVQQLVLKNKIITNVISPPEGIKDLRDTVKIKGKEKVKEILNVYFEKIQEKK